MDTYVDSSWYFLRYPTPDYDKGPFDKKIINDWLPTKVYFGGREHVHGHTLYARFITKFLQDIGYVNFDEFALKRVNHGVVLGVDGQKMSKSRGNVVNPDVEVKKYGADTVRMYLCFMGPHESAAPWSSEGVRGMHRFLKKVWNFFQKSSKLREETNKEMKRILHKTIKKVTEDIETFDYNTAISSLMEFFNAWKEDDMLLSAEDAIKVLKLLAPFAPHMTEELYQFLRSKKQEVRSKSFVSIHQQKWPKYDPDLIKSDEVTIVVQVNGRLRSNLKVSHQQSQDKSAIESIARKDEKVKRWLKEKVKNVIFVPGKLINFVV